MLAVLPNLLIISGVDAALALIIQIAKRYLADYGECTITLNEEKDVVVTGGLGRSGPTYRDPLYGVIRRQLPGCRLVDPVLDPVCGAVLLALELAGVEFGEVVIEGLRLASGSFGNATASPKTP